MQVGEFDYIGGQARNHLAALDASTGAATAWNPNADYSVSALAISGSTVYAGGPFANIGGQARNHIAALDATTGVVTAWNPSADEVVSALAIAGNTVYAGGRFTTIGGQARNRIAALDATTGAATTWNPNTEYEFYHRVNALVVLDNTVYVGGYFTGIGGQPRNNIAALDATTGFATSWNPNASGYDVFALALSGDTLYVGGMFESIGGATHLGAAAIATTDEVSTTPFDAQVNGEVYAVAMDDFGRVVVGGDFFQAGPLGRSNIARFNADGTLDNTWNPGADQRVLTLAVSDDTVYAGGGSQLLAGKRAIASPRSTPAPALPPPGIRTLMLVGFRS